MAMILWADSNNVTIFSRKQRFLLVKKINKSTGYWETQLNLQTLFSYFENM